MTYLAGIDPAVYPVAPARGGAEADNFGANGLDPRNVGGGQGAGQGGEQMEPAALLDEPGQLAVVQVRKEVIPRLDGGVQAVSYTHLTLPTNSSV